MATSRATNTDSIVMTREGYEKLKSELMHLRSEGREEIAKMLEEARSFGDLSENAEYHSAKEAQDKLESRIQWLEYQLSKAKVVDSHEVDASRVMVGTTVTLYDVDLQGSHTIVSTQEGPEVEPHLCSKSSRTGFDRIDGGGRGGRQSPQRG